MSCEAWHLRQCSKEQGWNGVRFLAAELVSNRLRLLEKSARLSILRRSERSSNFISHGPTATKSSVKVLAPEKTRTPTESLQQRRDFEIAPGVVVNTRQVINLACGVQAADLSLTKPLVWNSSLSPAAEGLTEQFRNCCEPPPGGGLERCEAVVWKWCRVVAGLSGHLDSCEVTSTKAGTQFGKAGVTQDSRVPVFPGRHQSVDCPRRVARLQPHRAGTAGHVPTLGSS